MNPFLIPDDYSASQKENMADKPDYKWLISADKIFESSINGYKEYAPFISVEFSVSRFSLFNGKKSSDSTICAKDVKIKMLPSRFCAQIQENLASAKEVGKITLKRVGQINGALEAFETKEFEKCIIQSFERLEDVAVFTFRCIKYSDSYQDFKKDGTKSGNASTKLDLSTWKVG